MRPIFLLILMALLADFPVQAELRFEAERLVLDAGPGEDAVTADFPFVNAGETLVRIESVISNCACLLAEAPEGDIPPGGKGLLHSVFKVGAFNGTVEKHLVVRVKEGGKPRNIALAVAVRVPDVIVIEPPTLVWKAGGEKARKTFRVKNKWEESIHLLSVESSRQEFDFEVETVKKGREYAVHVTPKTVEKPMLGLLQFRTDCRFEKYRNPMGFLHVRMPKQPEQP